MPTIHKYYRNVLITMGILFFVALVVAWLVKETRIARYEAAVNKFCSGDTTVAVEFRELKSFRDSASYLSALELYQDGKYSAAFDVLSQLDLPDTSTALLMEWSTKAQLQSAIQQFDEDDFEQSISLLSQLILELGSYDDPEDVCDYGESESAYSVAKEYLKLSYISYAEVFYEQKEYQKAIDYLEKANSVVQTFDSDIQEIENKYKYAYAEDLYARQNYKEALTFFLDLDNYGKSVEYVKSILDLNLDFSAEILYMAADQHYQAGQYWRALSELQRIKEYPGSKELAEKIEQILRENLATTISVGLNYSVAVKSDGTAMATGYKNNGQQGDIDGEEWSNLASIAGFSSFTAGLRLDGGVITTSRSINRDIASSDEWTNIVAISVGEAYIVGLKSDGTLVSAGHDLGDGQRDVDDWTNIVAIATGWRHTVGLDAAGNVFITGYGSSSQLNQIQKDKENWTNIVAIAAGGGSNGSPGRGHTVGLRKDGSVVAVGDNTYNQCNFEGWGNDVIAIAAGDWFTVALHSDGSISITSPDKDKEQEANLYTGACTAENWKNIKMIAAGGGSVVGLYENSTAIAAGYGEGEGQTAISNTWENVKQKT